MVVSYQRDVGRSNQLDDEIAPILCKVFGGDDFEVVSDRNRQIQGIDIIIHKNGRQILIDTKHAKKLRDANSVIVPWKRVITYNNGRSVDRPQDFFNTRARTQALVKCHKQGNEWIFNIIDFNKTKNYLLEHKDELVAQYGTRNIYQERRNADQVTTMSKIPLDDLAEKVPVKTIRRKV